MSNKRSPNKVAYEIVEEDCDWEMHEYFSNEMEYLECPFCEQIIADHHVKKEQPCCDNQELINDEGIVCKKCGLVQGYENFVEFVHFHKNKFKMKRKSVYYRKYYLINKIDTLCGKNKRQLTFMDKDKIMKVFKEIDTVLPQLNENRKRIVNIHNDEIRYWR